MKKKLKQTAIALAMVVASLLPVLAMPSIAFADLTPGLCAGSNLDLTNPQGQCPAAANGNIQQLLTTVINWISVIVGVIAVIMIIVGGLRYITSGGESGKVSSAKTTIIYALIGLVVVALAQLIVHFVLNAAQPIASGG